ncbi:hypothetical protein V1477_009700 [Vespula maculifrons]|uniref:Transmembrane protein n=1 Tax=Vespula maculifrons TaxID=7453 RepID=A0ABD2CAI0_VESMC
MNKMRRVYSVTNNKPMRRRTKVDVFVKHSANIILISAEKVVAVINQFQRCVVFLNFVSWRKYGGLLLDDSSPSLMEYETWTPLRLTNGAHEEKVSKAGSEVGHDFDRSQGPYSRGMTARKACHFVGAALVFALARTCVSTDLIIYVLLWYVPTVNKMLASMNLTM